MKMKIINIFVCMLLIAFGLTLFEAEVVIAEDPPDLPDEEWFVTGNGTYFEITNSSYLNVTLTSSENVHVHMESIPKIISYNIESNCSANSTLVTLTGFQINKTYYHYQDGGDLVGNFTTNETGSYSYTQDLATYHDIDILESISTIYILSNGTIDPPSAPISRIGENYTLTGNISEPIYIYRSGITFDGAGYTLGGGNWLYLYSVSGVTIKNFNIYSNSWWNGVGVRLYYSDNNLIENNSISNIHTAIYAYISDGNTFDNNIINHSRYGFYFYGVYYGAGCDQNIISNNTITDTHYGMYFKYSFSNNVIRDNTITSNYPIYFYYNVNSNTIERNHISGYYVGVYLYNRCHYNIINENVFQNGRYSGISCYNSYGRISLSNKITYNTILNNSYSNYKSINLGGCRYFTIHHNNIYNGHSQYNSFYNTWDDGLGEGNYWYDYTGTDTDGDGVGDTNLPHRGVDYYPLMSPWGLNDPPVANAGGPYEGDEGAAITFNASASSDPDGDELQYRWDFDNDSNWDITYSTDATATYTWYDDYSGTVVVNVYDGEYNVTNTTTVTVNNVAPTADAGEDKTGDEPSAFTFTGSHVDPGTLDNHTYEWDFDYDGVTFDVDATGNNVSNIWHDDFSGKVALRVTDDDGDSHIDTCNITVNNVAPQFPLIGLGVADNYIFTANYYAMSYYIDIQSDGSLGSPAFIDDKFYRTYGAGIGDFDNDGDLDALVGDYYNTWYYEKTGSGNSFAPAVSIDYSYHNYRADFAEADYNNDGNLDAIMAEYYDYSYEQDFTIYLGLGDGTFTISTMTAPLYVIGMDSADFNGDGNMDFIAATTAYGAYIYLGNGNGTFQPEIFLSIGYSWGVCAGDFDNDGDDDFIYGQPTMFYPGNGDGTFGTPVNLNLNDFYVYALAESDINGDGNLDIVYTTYNNIVYMTGNGDGTFSLESSIYVSYRLYGIATTSGGLAPIEEVNEGDMTIFIGLFSDPGWKDTHTATWDWGDGSSVENGTVTEENNEPMATGKVTGNHCYGDNGVYTITLTITDDDGASSTNTCNITVNNVAPRASVLGGVAVADAYIFASNYNTRSYFIDILDNGSFESPELVDDKSSWGTYGAGIGDFDNDGDLDALVGDYYNTWYYEKTGYGNSYASAVSIDSTSYSYRADFAEADYDNDGNLDAIMANRYTYYFTIYLGNGDGTFTRSTMTAPDYYIIGMDSADFNGDGNMDFIAASWSYGAYIYLGNGDGTFQPYIFLSIGYSWGVCAGDFDNDGDDDFIFGRDAYFYPGNNDGTFGSSVFLNLYNVYALAELDIDGDGNLDIVYSDNYNIRYMTGNGDGTFSFVSSIPIYYDLFGIATSTEYGLISHEGNMTQFNGSFSDQGWLDTHTATWNWGDGSSTENGTVTEENDEPFATGNVTGNHVYDTMGEYTITLTLTDDDGGIVIDIATVVVINPLILDVDAGGPYIGEEGSVIVFDASVSNSGVPMSWLQYRWDLNNDGTWDTNYSKNPKATHIWADDHTGNVTVEVFNGWYTFTDTANVTVNNVAPRAVLLGGIAIADNYIFASNSYTMSYFIDILDDGSLASPAFIDDKDSNTYGAGIGDFDNDGDLDALVGDRYNTWYYEKTGSGNSFAPAVSIDSTYHWARMDFAEADYNNDGNLDAIMADYNVYYFTLYLGNGDGTFTRSTMSAPWSIIGMDSADFNGDGNMDFIAASYSSGAYIYLGNGDGTFQPQIFLNIEQSWGVCAGDFDNDGNDDFIFGRYTSGYSALKFYSGNGDGTFSAGVTLGFPVTAYALAESDIDGDGNLDIVYTSSNSVYYMSGNGDGTFSFVSSIYVTSSLYSIATSSEFEELIVDEGNITQFTGKFSDPGWNDVHTAIWDWGDSNTESGTVTEENEEPFATGEVTGEHCYGDNGEYIVTLTVTDDDGGFGSSNTTITVLNVPPVAEAGPNQTVDEGDIVYFDGSGTYDPGFLDVLNYTWDYGDGSSPVSGVDLWDPTHVYGDNGIYTVTLTVEDDDGENHTDNMTVTVNNVAPVISSFIGPLDPININNPVEVDGAFTDAGFLDTHTATIDWDDGNITSATVVETDGCGTVNDSHYYGQTGVYTIMLNITDDDGDSDEMILSYYIVIYDPSAGFVTGGGWINSPEGAYTPNPNLTGKANFGFVSKYKKGQQNPTGNTEFQFHAADMNFHSDSYDWLVITNHKAMYKGTGTINGSGNYGFMLSAIDEELTNSTEVDLFRIKIWDIDNDDEVIYDNMLGEDEDEDPTTEISGGNIKIHKGN